MQADPDNLKISEALSKQILASYQPASEVLPRIAEIVSRHQRFVLTTHQGADADGLGSQLGMYYLLKALGKDCLIINSEAAPEGVVFLDNNHLVDHVDNYSESSEKQQELVEKMRGAFVLILDSSELRRSQKVADYFLAAGCDWASIDHHILPPDEHYCIDSSYSATAELIWDLYQFMRVPLNQQAAIALYAGMVSDTGNFRYPKTSFRTHLAAGHLLSFEINSEYIYRALYESHPFDRHLLLKKIYSKAIFQKELGYVVGEIRPSYFKKLHLGDQPSEGIVNQLLAVSGVKIAALMTETDEGQLKCSLRSLGDVDVASIARQFGGGGHKNAAGLKLSLPYRKARKLLLAAIEEYLAKLKQVF